MPVSKLSPVAWVSGIALAWLIMGFVFAQINASPSEPGLAGRAAATLDPSPNRILIVGGSNAATGLHNKDLALMLGRPVLDVALIGSGGDGQIVGWNQPPALLLSGRNRGES